MSEEKHKAILIGQPSIHMKTVMDKLKATGQDFIVVDPSNKEQMAEIAKMQNPVFLPPPIPYTNPYKDIIELKSPTIENFGTGQKKFRKQNNRKHKKSRK